LCQPPTLLDRLAAATKFADGRAFPVLVDGMDNALELAYEARPEKLVAVRDGLLVFLSGIGPYQYSPRKLQEWLAHQLN